jgi:hypothetical protein
MVRPMPNILALAHWLLIAMGSFYPQESHRFIDEDKNITEERYEEIAYDIAFAVSQPYVRPAFDDKDPIAARAKTGLLLASIGADESRYIEDVEMCRKGGDHGHSWGLFQTSRAKTLTCQSVPLASAVAIDMVRESFRISRTVSRDEITWLAEYTDGLQYDTPKARGRSARRMGRMLRWWAEHPYREQP